MARNRMIKPEFWEDDKIGECSPTARLLFIALWNFADDEGYLEYRSKWIKAKCFPYDDVEIEPLIDELLSVNRLELRGNVLWIIHFLEHQKIEKPRKSDLSHIFNSSPTPPRKVDDSSGTKREEKRKEIEEKGSEEEGGGDESPNPTPSQTMKDFIEMILGRNEMYEPFVTQLSESKGLPVEIVRAELDRFINHWCEHSKNGKKQKWEMERTFEVPNRLRTWFSNYLKWNPPKESQTAFISS